jgi:dTMP kinase
MNKFIAFDGPDGVGKSTLVNGVRDALLQRNVRVFHLHEWKRGPFESIIRKLSTSKHDPFVLFTWVLASRAYTIEKQVLPALAGGKVVLLDRYYAASLVYQRLEGIDIGTIERFLNAFAQPDVHIQLRCPVEIMRQRLLVKSEVSNVVTLSQLARLYDEAFDILTQRGEQVCTLDTSLSPDRLVKEALSIILEPEW